MRLLALLLLSLLTLGCAHRSPPVTARPADVETIDGLIRAFYEVVNVGPDEPRQWARDRTLYSPWIRFVSIGKGVTIYDHPALVAATEPMIRTGFREREIHRVVHRYGNVAQVESTYETRSGPEERLSRGVNQLQLYHDGTRWWIASVAWQTEGPQTPIPPELLPPTQ